MEYLAIITMEVPGRCAATLASLVSMTSQLTRLDIYNYMRGEVAKNYGEQFAHGTVIYFSAEPNTLGT
jgi:hypothetical protein